MAKKQELPDISQWDMKRLTDEIGALRTLQKQNKTILEYYEAAYKARLPEELAKVNDPSLANIYRGDKYVMERTLVVQERFDPEKAKSFLTPEQLAECIKPLQFYQLRFKPLAEGG